MKKIIWIVVITILVILGFKCCSNYNQMVTLDEQVQSQWGNVENVYQRRADLIPSLVSTVKGAANFEQATLTQVIDARAKATSIQINPGDLTEANIQRFQRLQGELSSALSRLLVTVERYPELKATQQFRDLMVQLEGTENRIAVERRSFNEQVKAYNRYIRSFPQVIFAGWFGFDKRGYFQAEPGAEKRPDVEFGDFGANND